MITDTFWNGERSVVQTSEGSLRLPIFYRDFSSVMQVFQVDPQKVRPLLEGTGLEPCVLINGRAAIILVFFEYRDTSIGSYNEVGLCSFTYSNKLKKPSFHLPDFFKKGANWKSAAYVHNLPVTTEVANAAGRKIWGYPKFVTEIPFSLSRNSFEGAVLDPETDEEILSIAGGRGVIGPGFMLPGIDIVTYSINHRKQVRTVITTEGKANYNLFPSMRLKVGTSNHGMAKNLRHLGLDNARPSVLITSYNTRSILPEGIVVSELSGSPELVGAGR